MNLTVRSGLCLLLGVSCLLVASHATIACTCDLPQKGKSLKQQVAAARNKSSAVFIGKVLEVNSDPKNLYVDVKFEVERSWKHDTNTQVIVRTGRGGGNCGYHFEVRESYLVYAYQSSENKLETNICQRTRSVADAKDDLVERNPLSTTPRRRKSRKTQHDCDPSDAVYHRFAKERDIETGVDYFLTRYYSSMQGRFTSPDEFTGGPRE